MKNDSTRAFIDYLEKLSRIHTELRDRRVLAALRRCLSNWPAAAPEAIRIVAPFIPEDARGSLENRYYLIAGLFALHPCSSKLDEISGPSLGKSLRSAADKDKDKDKDTGKGPERRLIALLSCKSEDLPVHLRHAISYLSSKEIAVDYRRLMDDLRYWDSDGGNVQKNWGRDFWSGSTAKVQETAIETKIEENTNVH